MKKNFKFMLTALLATFGFSNASAQDLAKGATVRDAYYQYELVTAPAAVEGQDDAYTANVALIAINNGKNPVVNGAIYMPENGIITTTYGSETYTLTLTQIGKPDDPATPEVETVYSPLRNLDLATSVTIPATLKAIPEACFEGCSAMTSITFAPKSQVETIGSHAFATTKITDFDFSPCEKLAGLPDEVFVQEGLNNTYITNVTVPDAPLFKHINGAFKNLTALQTITNLENSWIEEVIAKAFDGCEELKTLSLPGNNLRFVDQKALDGSSIETLSIDVSSIEYLGGYNVSVEEGEEGGAAVAETNLYGQSAIGNTPLKSLTLTGTLTGIIATKSFAWCDKLNQVLDFTGMTLGSTGQLQTGAFKDCYKAATATAAATGIRGVKINEIITNTLADGYTIDERVFEGCELLSYVEIASINTEKAIGPAAFGEKLKTVKIGTIKAGAEALAAKGEETKGAFVWDNVSGAELELAQFEGSYLFANQVTTPIIGAGAFDMSAITGNQSDTFVWPTITIGEIRSKGGVFAKGAIVPPTKIGDLTFNGEIAANGLDVAIIDGDEYTGLTAITFTDKSKIGRGGINTGAFANITKINTLNFSGLLAENAVKVGAFKFPIFESEEAFEARNPKTNYALNYTCQTIRDWTVNPFEKGALNSEATAQSYRYILLNGDLFEALKANYEDEVKGLGTDGQFDIYLVKFDEAEDVTATTFLLYQNGSTTNAWGRYDLGSFKIEKGENYKADATREEIAANPKLAGYQAADMVIERYQVVQGGAATVKLTIYGMYGDSDANPLAGDDDSEGESLVYMVPLQVFDGKYYISSENLKTLVIKAEAIKGAFNNKKVPVAYSVWEASVSPVDTPDGQAPAAGGQMPNSVWEALPDYGEDRAFTKNDKENEATKTVDVITTQILWDRTDAEYDVWGSAEAVDHDLQYAPYAVYSISNPANYQGVQLVKLLVSKTSGKIGANWYYMLMPHFKKAAEEETQGARIVWLDEAQATAIFGVKELKAKANAENGAIYNLQGVRVNNASKGLYIMNGKKYVVK